jgi:hypothetical protein
MAEHKLKGCPSSGYTEQTITEIIKVVFAQKNVRRAPGNAGRLVRFKATANETETNIYLTADGKTAGWPGSMHLVVSVLSSETFFGTNCPFRCQYDD